MLFDFENKAQSFDTFDGVHTNWYLNGQMESRYTYVRGILDGLCEQWFESGQIRLKFNCSGGKRHGLFESWSNNGQLVARINYNHGKLHGAFETSGSVEYFYSDVQVTEKEYCAKIKEQSGEITRTTGLTEKALGVLIAEYCDLLPSAA